MLVRVKRREWLRVSRGALAAPCGDDFCGAPEAAADSCASVRASYADLARLDCS